MFYDMQTLVYGFLGISMLEIGYLAIQQARGKTATRSYHVRLGLVVTLVISIVSHFVNYNAVTAAAVIAVVALIVIVLSLKETGAKEVVLAFCLMVGMSALTLVYPMGLSRFTDERDLKSVKAVDKYSEYLGNSEKLLRLSLDYDFSVGGSDIDADTLTVLSSITGKEATVAEVTDSVLVDKAISDYKKSRE
jgi:hypothetical protein|nr:MAG TPA: hypothetical protein [Caudoviricetes sp.]